VQRGRQRFGPAFLPGATVFGYLKADCGVGEAARNLFLALRSVNYPVAAKCLSRQFEENDTRLESEFVERSRYRYHIFHANAENALHLSSFVHPTDLRGRYRIGVWAWELARFPEAWLKACEHLDEIWVPSRFVRDAVAPVVSKPVLIFPHAVPLPETASNLGRAYFGLRDDAFVVLVALDLHSQIDRKNPLAAIAAVRRAFEPGDRRIQLVIKLHGIGFAQERARLAYALSGMENAVVIDRLLTRREMTGLQACCDVFLSLHRSEGFGLNIAECMAHAKCVIATNYSGNVDFFDATCGAPVGYRLVGVKPGEYIFPQDQYWAEPDIEEAAELLNRAADDPAWRTALGNAARARIGSELSCRVVGEKMAERLNALDARLARAGHW
jgi:glycosyltransferase involved in cell wall biosynthesis